MNRAERRMQEEQGKNRVNSTNECRVTEKLTELKEYFTKYVNIFVDTHQWSDMYLRRSTEVREYYINNSNDREEFVNIFVVGLFKECLEMTGLTFGEALRHSQPLHDLLFMGLVNVGYDLGEMLKEHPTFAIRHYL